MNTQTQISAIITLERVLIDLASSTKTRLLQILSEKAGKAIGIDAEKVFNALFAREALGSTGIGEGIAIPHARMTEISTPFGMLARLAKPLSFDSIDELPVDVVFLLLTPAEDGMAHLNVLACIAKQLRSQNVLIMIRSASSQDAVYAAITQ